MRRHNAGAILHLAMGERDRPRSRAARAEPRMASASSLTKIGDAALDDHRCSVDRGCVIAHCTDRLEVGSADLVDDDDICHAEVGRSRPIGELVPGTVRIGHDDVEVWLVEWQVVVAAILR